MGCNTTFLPVRPIQYSVSAIFDSRSLASKGDKRFSNAQRRNRGHLPCYLLHHIAAEFTCSSWFISSPPGKHSGLRWASFYLFMGQTYIGKCGCYQHDHEYHDADDYGSGHFGVGVRKYQDMGVVGFNLEVICPTGYFTSSTDASGCTQSLSQPTSRPTEQPTSVPTRRATTRSTPPPTSTPTSISKQSAPHSRRPHKGTRGFAVHTGKSSSKKSNAKTIDVNVDVDVRIDTH